jgi:hypothetical protein
MTVKQVQQVRDLVLWPQWAEGGKVGGRPDERDTR